MASNTTQEKSVDSRNSSDELVPSAHIIFIAMQPNGSLTQEQISTHRANGGKNKLGTITFNTISSLRFVFFIQWFFYAFIVAQWIWCDAWSLYANATESTHYIPSCFWIYYLDSCRSCAIKRLRATLHCSERQDKQWIGKVFARTHGFC